MSAGEPGTPSAPETAYGGVTPPGYGYAYGGPPAPLPPTNSLAVVSLVASITGVTILPVIGSVIGVICGHISLGQLKRTGERGKGMATAGLVVGYVGAALVVAVGIAIAYALAGLGTLVWMYS